MEAALFISLPQVPQCLIGLSLLLMSFNRPSKLSVRRFCALIMWPFAALTSWYWPQTICLRQETRPTQPSILPGSVNEYQLRLGRQRQVWFIPLADERGVCRWNCEIPWERVPYLSERLRGVFTTRRYTNTRLPYLTLPGHQLWTIQTTLVWELTGHGTSPLCASLRHRNTCT